MKNQVKVLSLVALCTMTTGMQAGFATDVKPNVLVGYVQGLVAGDRNKSLGILAAAIAAGSVAYQTRAFSYDDKGTRSITGDSDASPFVADLFDAVAAGAGITFACNMVLPQDMSFKSAAEDAALNTVSAYVAEKLVQSSAIVKLDRNHWALRGWLPCDFKLDAVYKKIALGIAARGVVGAAWDSAKTKLAAK